MPWCSETTLSAGSAYGTGNQGFQNAWVSYVSKASSSGSSTGSSDSIFFTSQQIKVKSKKYGKMGT